MAISNQGDEEILREHLERNKMPTGYTAAIADDISFEQFAMTCARAMGALVTMRDAPSGAEIPERFEPSNYHVKKIAELGAEIDRLERMTYAEADMAAGEAYSADVARHSEAVQRMDALREKYQAMLAKVNAWQPPSADHENFKAFMIEQITSSIAFDCNSRYYLNHQPVAFAGLEWRDQQLRHARESMTYHLVENAKEVQRTEERNTWLRLLRESLKQFASQ